MAGGNLGGLRLQQTGQSPYGWAPGAQSTFAGTQFNPQLYGGPWNQLTQMMAGPQFNSDPYQQPYGTAGNMRGQPGQPQTAMNPQAAEPTGVLWWWNHALPWESLRDEHNASAAGNDE